MASWITWGNRLAGPKYQSIGKAISPSFEKDDESLPSRKRRGGQRLLPWIISTLLLGCTTILLLIKSWQLSAYKEIGSYERGFRTELAHALQGSSLDEISFTGGLSYNESGRLVIEQGPDIWIGDPSPEIDAVWDRIEDELSPHSADVLYLEGEDADLVRESTTFRNGYWLTGLDVFHQIHCLNIVRKALYPEYYKQDPSDRTAKLHMEHCFNYVRQAVMCNADLTPVRNKWFPTAGIFGPDFSTKHTCRNFETLFDWAKARSFMRGPGTEIAKDESLMLTDEHHYAQASHHGHGKYS